MTSGISLVYIFHFSLKKLLYRCHVWFTYSLGKADNKISLKGESMTKDDLVTAVVKSCKGDDLSKRLVSDVIDATFESIGKSIKKDKRFSYPAFGTFTVRNRKLRKGEIHKLAKK